MFKKGRPTRTERSAEYDQVDMARSVARAKDFGRLRGYNFLVGISGERDGRNAMLFYYSNGEVRQGVDAANQYLLEALRAYDRGQ
jgi:hypothetical protein